MRGGMAGRSSLLFIFFPIQMESQSREEKETYCQNELLNQPYVG
jgi:hypothetical protein